MDQEAPVIVSRDSAFARDVFVERHPARIAQVADVFPFGPDQQKALAGLAEENVRGVITPLPDSAHDSKQWSAWGKGFSIRCHAMTLDQPALLEVLEALKVADVGDHSERLTAQLDDHSSGPFRLSG